MPIAGHAGLGGKNTNALACMREAVRIDDLSQPAPTRVGEADDGTPTPIGYTGTQFIAVLECDPVIEPDTAARPACSKPASKYGPTLAEDLPIATERCSSFWSRARKSGLRPLAPANRGPQFCLPARAPGRGCETPRRPRRQLLLHPLHRVRVDIRGHRGPAVPDPLRDRLEVPAVRQEGRDVAVAQGVEFDPG